MEKIKRVLGAPSRAIRRLYAWMMRWARTKQAEWALAGFSFAESSFFPIPPDPLLIAITTARPKSWKRLATICVTASVVGGILGYFIGYGLFQAVGQKIISAYNLGDEFIRLGSRYEANAFLTIFIAAFTPIPYKVITISAGVFSINLPVMILASILGRGGRFYAVAFLAHHLGKRYQKKIEKYIDIISLVFVVVLLLGFFLIKLL